MWDRYNSLVWSGLVFPAAGTMAVNLIQPELTLEPYVEANPTSMSNIFILCEKDKCRAIFDRYWLKLRPLVLGDLSLSTGGLELNSRPPGRMFGG